MKYTLSIALAASLSCIGAAPVFAPKLGVGGTGVDEASALTTCPKPLGTSALVKEKIKADPRMDALPPQFRATMEMAQAQKGGGGSVDPLPLLKLLVAQVIYSDAKSRQSGGAVGGLIGWLGFQQKTLEGRTMLTLTSVKTGVQVAVASGQARKKDIGILFRGLSNLGVGALGGTYASSDMGEITALALLDGFRKLTVDAQAAIPAQ